MAHTSSRMAPAAGAEPGAWRLPVAAAAVHAVHAPPAFAAAKRASWLHNDEHDGRRLHHCQAALLTPLGRRSERARRARRAALAGTALANDARRQAGLPSRCSCLFVHQFACSRSSQTSATMSAKLAVLATFLFALAGAIFAVGGLASLQAGARSARGPCCRRWCPAAPPPALLADAAACASTAGFLAPRPCASLCQHAFPAPSSPPCACSHACGGPEPVQAVPLLLVRACSRACDRPRSAARTAARRLPRCRLPGRSSLADPWPYPPPSPLPPGSWACWSSSPWAWASLPW